MNVHNKNEASERYFPDASNLIKMRDNHQCLFKNKGVFLCLAFTKIAGRVLLQLQLPVSNR